MTAHEQLQEQLNDGDSCLVYQDIPFYAHKMPNGPNSEERGWRFIWIGGYSESLQSLLGDIDELLLTGYLPGTPLPCKNCSQQVVVDVYDKIPGLSNHEHLDGNYYCHDVDILPTTPPAKCHICKVEQPPHGSLCSAGGLPRHSAKPKLPGER